MYCPDEGPAADSAARKGIIPLSSSRQAHDIREQEDKDVRTSNYAPATCEIRALEVLAENNAQGDEVKQHEKEECSGGSEGLRKRSSARPLAGGVQ